MADPQNTPLLITASGFQLRILVTNWYGGISIFQVKDGPSTGDLAADFQRVQTDLLTDDRTQFVTTVNGGGDCIVGLTDVFSINKTMSTNLEHLTDYDLQIIEDKPNVVIARWTNAKSMSLESKTEQLKAAGIEADDISIGCGV